MADSSWFSLPTRRELLLLIFALATFSISYNLDASLHYLGLGHAKVQPSQSLLLHKLPSRILPSSHASQRVVGTDGLKPPLLRDRLEQFIYGTFPWLPHHLANSSFASGVPKHIEYYTPAEVDPTRKLLQGKPGSEIGRIVGKEKKVGDYQVWPFNAFWLGEKAREAPGWRWPRLSLQEKEGKRVFTQSEIQGKESNRVQDGFWRWAEAVGDDGEVDEDEEVEWHGPRSTIVQYVPGTNFAIIDHVLLFNGTVYVVLESEQVEDFELQVPGWQVISPDDASKKLGDFAGVIKGASWIVLDTEPHATGMTLLALQKLHSLLSCAGSESVCNSTTSQTQPDRIIYPNMPTFLSPNNPRRSPIGVHPYTLKSAWPHTGLLFREDWEDYVGIGLHETVWSEAHVDSEAWKALREERKRKPGWVFERIVVGYSGSGSVPDENEEEIAVGNKVLERVFNFDRGVEWFNPPRQRLAEVFGLVPVERKGKHYSSRFFGGEKDKRGRFGHSHKRVTVISAGDEEEVKDVRTLAPQTPWAERMRTLLETDILICFIHCVADAVWMHTGQVVDATDADGDELGKTVVESLGLKWMGHKQGRSEDIEEMVRDVLGSLDA